MTVVHLLTDEGTIEVVPPRGKAVALLSVRKVAELYGVRPAEVYKALRDHRIPGHKFGWNWLCLEHELPDMWPDDERNIAAA